MASGNPSAPESPARGAAPPPLAVAALALAALFSCLSCARPQGGGFERELGRIDAALAEGDRKACARAYARAYKAATKSADWLSLLKRAHPSEGRGDRGRLVETARRAAAAMPASEAVAAASAHALLRGGDPASALALFRGPLPPDARPALWSECFLAAVEGRGSPVPAFEPADLARLAAALDRPAAYAGAAALALARGRPAEAASFAASAEAAGAAPPISLLWDCGLFEALAGRSEDGASAPELAILGDAAWRSGDAELAMARWEASIARDPRSSWKSYAKLAFASGDRELTDSYLSRMRAAFLSGPLPSPGAALAHASILAARGGELEALAILAPFAGSDAAAAALSLRARAGAWPEGRLAAEAVRLAAGGLPDAEGYSLAILAALGRVDELLLLVEAAEAKGIEYPDRWFYRAAALAARGRYAEALAAIDSSGSPGPEASLASGLLYDAMGDYPKAAAALRAAALSFEEPRQRCRAFKALGAAAARAGQAGAAAEAYRAAASADPGDSEAALLARGP